MARWLLSCVLKRFFLLILQGFKPFAMKYRDSEAAFFADYAIAHKKVCSFTVSFPVCTASRDSHTTQANDDEDDDDDMMMTKSQVGTPPIEACKHT